MKLLGAAILLLGCYHIALQLVQSSSSAPTSRPCQRAASARTAAASRHGNALDERLAAVVDSTAHENEAEDVDDAASDPLSAAGGDGEAAPAAWRRPSWSNLEANEQASSLLAAADPRTTTLHFTFGSLSMMEFLRNWRHFVLRLGLAPALVGAADVQMLGACTREGIAALGIAAGLDVWNYTRGANVSTVVQSGTSEWKYYRHHKSSFLELGLVRAAVLLEHAPRARTRARAHPACTSSRPVHVHAHGHARR